MNVTDYVLLLSFDTRYRVWFEVDKGNVLQFAVQLETKEGDKWVPVVRYDTAHGFAHRDRYKADGTISHHELLPVSEYREALNFSIRDVKLTWEDWIRQYRE